MGSADSLKAQGRTDLNNARPLLERVRNKNRRLLKAERIATAFAPLIFLSIGISAIGDKGAAWAAIVLLGFLCIWIVGLIIWR